MGITVEFKADNFEELVGQIMAFMGLHEPVTPVKETPVVEAGGNPSGFSIGTNYEKAKVSHKKKVKPEAQAEEPPPHPDLIEKENVKEPEPEPEDDPTERKADIAMETLKNQQLDRLRDLFSAGKVKFVRELLAQHGGGAKVFPEVDVLAFPAIKKAIDKEMGLQ